jgi:heme/copper-type cytochrome/quinol oxidase subunit 2
MKMDALPGKTTTLEVTPDQLGSFESEPTLRVQCAELCGTGHPRMQMGIRILEPEEFDTWLAATKGVVESGGMEMNMDMGSGDEMNMDSGDGEMNMDSGDAEMNMDAGDGGGMEMDSGNMDTDQ